MTRTRSHQVGELLMQGSQQAPILHSLPLPAPYLLAASESLVFLEEAKLHLYLLPQNILLPCLARPSCLLVPQANSCSTFQTQLKSHLLHEAFPDLPRVVWTAPPLTPLSVL